MREVLIAGLALGFVCSCQPANCPDGGAADLFAAGDVGDSAAAAYVSPRRDGMGDGLHDLAEAPKPPMPDLAGKPVIDDAVCNACEMQQCRNVDGNDWYAYCFLTTDPVTVGPGAGSKFSELCLKVLQCARKTGCASVDPVACYCGQGVSDVVCLGQPAGSCVAEFQAAAESSHISDVIDRLSDPSYPVGAAFNLLRYCEVPICGASCAGGGGSVDAGVTPDLASRPDLSLPPDLSSKPDLTILQVGLLRNGRFDADVSSWTAEYGATASWEGPPDALGGPSSGSIVVRNNNVFSNVGITLTAASQCVPATSLATYHVTAQALIAAGQGTGSAGLAVQFFSSADCSGSVAGAWSSPVISTAGAWTAITGSFAAPATTGSMRVRLAALKPFSAAVFQTHFDNVLVETP